MLTALRSHLGAERPAAPDHHVNGYRPTSLRATRLSALPTGEPRVDGFLHNIRCANAAFERESFDVQDHLRRKISEKLTAIARHPRLPPGIFFLFRHL
jgi:hypothetical protein